MLFVVRHGKTDLNEQHRFNCRIDEDINQTGILQALNLKDELQNYKFDLVFCSPLLRARHTLELLDIKDVPTIFDERLLEREGGALTGALVDPEFYDNTFYDINASPEIEGLETVKELLDRVAGFLDEVKEKYGDKNILIVTHGGVIKAIRCYFDGIPKDGKLGNMIFGNCNVMTFEFDKKL